MCLYDLATELEHTGLDEDTTMANITYLPSGFTSLQKALQGLAKKKKEWKVEILEFDEERIVNFEKELSIRVSNNHWDHFVNKVFGSKMNTFDWKQTVVMPLLVEDIGEELDKATNSLQEAIVGAFDTIPLEELDDDILKFKNLFGIQTYLDIDTLMRYQNKEDDMYKVLEAVKGVYKDDIGHIELIAKAFREKRPLGMFAPFRDSNMLYGVSVRTSYRKVKILFEGWCDNIWMITERLLVEDRDVVDQIEELGSVGVVKTSIFPKGRRFRKDTFQNIKDIIDEME